MTADDRPLSSIAIFGKSQDLWSVAALLSESLPDHIDLILVEDASEPIVPAALTLPYDSSFHKRIGIEAKELILQCNGTWGLGTDCIDWQGAGSSSFVAASGTLPMINGFPLHQIMLRAAYLQDQPERFAYLFQPFRFCARAAVAGKLALPSDAPQSPSVMLGPTVQFDRRDYTVLLKDRFGSIANAIHQAKAVSVSIDKKTRTIRSVQLNDRKEVAADFFVDVSGSLSDLLPDDDQSEFQSLADILPFDRIVSGARQKQQPRKHTNTHAHALSGGVLIETPLRSGQISELLFASAHIDQSAAAKMVGNDTDANSFKAKYMDNPWTGNLVRLGSAALCLGPNLSADTLALLQQSLILVDHIPAASQMECEAKAFNQHQKAAIEEIRDFITLPFLLNSRKEALWQDIGHAPLPESLQIRVEQFKSRARFVPYAKGIFDDQSWIDMMIGLGILPERYDARIDAIDVKKLVPSLKKIADDFNRTIDAMPNHSEYTADFLDRALSS